jgi:hypothetical protein
MLIQDALQQFTKFLDELFEFLMSWLWGFQVTHSSS